jgi:glyoxylase-like metal-dependent hydrolase (beta-lactamase superfamily II)
MTRGEYLQAKQIIEDYAGPVPPEHLRFFHQAGWSPEMLERHQPFGKSMTPLPGQYHRIKEGDVLAVGEQCWQVITTCGHSPEHACLYDARQQLLIAGDQLLPDVSSNVSVMPVEPWGNPMKDWLASLQKMATLFDDDVLVLPAHGAPFRGIPERAKQLAAKRLRALDRLRERLREQGPQRAIDVYPALFSAGSFANPFQHTLATGEAMAYLNYLLGEGEAVVQADANGVNWYGMA